MKNFLKIKISREQKFGLPFVFTWLGVSFFVPYFLNISLWDKASLGLGLLFLGPPVLGVSLFAIYYLLYNLFFKIPHIIGAEVATIIDSRKVEADDKQSGEVSLQIGPTPPAKLSCAHSWLTYWDHSKDRCIKCYENYRKI